MSSTPRTDRREKNQREYQQYYERHPEQTLKDQERQNAYQEESRSTAGRDGQTWTSHDLATALRLQQPIMVSAQEAQRTYAAIRQGRYRFIRQSGLRNTLLKGETEEYDALIRHEDFTVEDLLEHETRWRAIFEKTMPVYPEDGRPARYRQAWQDWEVDMVLDETYSARQLAGKLGRTRDSIETKRKRLRDSLGRQAP